MFFKKEDILISVEKVSTDKLVDTFLLTKIQRMDELSGCIWESWFVVWESTKRIQKAVWENTENYFRILCRDMIEISQGEFNKEVETLRFECVEISTKETKKSKVKKKQESKRKTKTHNL